MTSQIVLTEQLRLYGNNTGFQDLTLPPVVFPLLEQIKLLPGNGIANRCKYRRVSVVGRDYTVIYDAADQPKSQNEFLWITDANKDISRFWQLLPGTLRVASHRKNVSAVAAPFGAVVQLPDCTDYIFEHSISIHHTACDIAFYGYSGILRLYRDGSCCGSMTDGSQIDCYCFHASVRGQGILYFSCTVHSQYSGIAVAYEKCTLTIQDTAVLLERGIYSWQYDGKLQLQKKSS